MLEELGREEASLGNGTVARRRIAQSWLRSTAITNSMEYCGHRPCQLKDVPWDKRVSRIWCNAAQ